MKHTQPVIQAARGIVGRVHAILTGNEPEGTIKVPAEQIMADIITRHLAEERREVVRIVDELRMAVEAKADSGKRRQITVSPRMEDALIAVEALLSKLEAQVKGE